MQKQTVIADRAPTDALVRPSPSDPAVVDNLRGAATDLTAQAQRYAVIKTRQQLEEAGVVLVEGVRAMERRIREKLDPIVKLQRDAAAATSKLRSDLLAPVLAAKNVLDNAIRSYNTRMQAAREALAAKDAVAAERTGLPAPAPPPEVAKVEGVSVRKRWAFEVIDPAALSSLFVRPDESKIRRQVDALGDDAVSVVTAADAGRPAIRVWRDDVVASSRQGGVK